MIIPVILCGGSGTRLWPLSRKLYPKQLLALTGKNTLLQQTALRLEGMEGVAGPIVICNEEHRFMVAEQLRETGITPEAIILEPTGRNTAPATALAAIYCMHDGADPVLLVLPADHLIEDVEHFRKAVKAGGRVAHDGKLVTFGIIPSGPETGYGYIRKGREYPGVEAGEAYEIEKFVEKPDTATAERYLEEGMYLWNSGMFMFLSSLYIRELEQQDREMYRQCSLAMEGSGRDLDFTRPGREAFENCPDNSIDYAIMENTENGVVIPMDAGWNDIGSWSALWDTGEKDEHNNVLAGDVILHDTRDSFICSTERLVTAVGVSDSVIVETADAVLVAARNKVQDVKKIVEILKLKGREESSLHRRVYRPWGSYESIMHGDRFQVKLISVNPGAKLSLQMHHHRAEHWIVVKGTARIRKGDDTFILSENKSTYIPLGTVHQLENPGVIPLELIEVQSGSYLGEDDIKRFEDIYGRAEEK